MPGWIDVAVARPTGGRPGSGRAVGRSARRARHRSRETVGRAGHPGRAGRDADRCLGRRRQRRSAEHPFPATRHRGPAVARPLPVRAAARRPWSSATPWRRRCPSACRASTSGRSRSCWARASRGLPTGRATPAAPTRSCRPMSSRTSRSCAATRSTWTSRRPEFLVHTHTLDGLRERHLANYASAWDQTGGFRELLRAGGTYFSSDDHDFWNNAPNATVIARDTWSQDGRANWRDAARTMYDAFQRPIDRAPTSFTVGDLSVFVADTRLDRTEGTEAFATDAQLSAIESWIHGLQGPGCLVVGQLVFSGRAGWKGRWMDYGLADFGSYRRLVEALLSAEHSIVILTGDVHFGRVAVSVPRSTRRHRRGGRFAPRAGRPGAKEHLEARAVVVPGVGDPGPDAPARPGPPRRSSSTSTSSRPSPSAGPAGSSACACAPGRSRPPGGCRSPATSSSTGSAEPKLGGGGPR